MNNETVVAAALLCLALGKHGSISLPSRDVIVECNRATYDNNTNEVPVKDFGIENTIAVKACNEYRPALLFNGTSMGRRINLMPSGHHRDVSHVVIATLLPTR